MKDDQDQAREIELAGRLAGLEQRVAHIDALLGPLVRDVHAISLGIKNRTGFAAGVISTVSLFWVLVIAVVGYFMQRGDSSG